VPWKRDRGLCDVIVPIPEGFGETGVWNKKIKTSSRKNGGAELNGDDENLWDRIESVKSHQLKTNPRVKWCES